MILCDIGNTHYHFFYDGRDFKFKHQQKPVLKNSEELPSKNIYYISVNEKAEKKLLKSNSCINLDPYINLNSYYDLEELGVDRAVSCITIKDGIIVDAGSAITIDVMKDGWHMGGYILPGFSYYRETFNRISPILNQELEFGVDIHKLPLNTKDAMSASVIRSNFLLIKNLAKDMPIIFTGGDGKFLSKFFPEANALYNGHIIFEGMKKVIQENNLLELKDF